MAEVKWIKIVTEIFDNRKIRQLESLPDGDSIIVIWFKLLCLAGNVNDNGLIYFTQEIPYTDQMLSSQFNRPLSTVQMALSTFQKFGMIEVIDDILKISNWEKYQNVDKMNEIREYNRLAQQRRRRRLVAESSATDDVNDKSMTSQPCQDTDIDKDTDIDSEIDTDIDIDSEKDGENTSSPQAESTRSCPFSKIKSLYLTICVSFPKIQAIDGSRKNAVAARWRSYKNLDKFEEVFRLAESSPFLKGENDRNWAADFDWMMKPTNFSKILEHKYDARPASEIKPTGVLGTLAKMYEEAGGNNDGTGNS